jgi:hypothetical protein
MKKTHLIVAAMFICTMALVNKTNAQTSKNISLLVDARTMANALSILEPAESINTKAMRDFKKNYPNVDGEIWYSFKDGFAAKFNENGIRHMIFYSRVGGLLYNVTSYGEKKLPENVRALVKSTYYDYSITMIEEINFQQQTMYLVHIQDESTWKIVRVYDGELSVIEDFNKG